MTKAEPFAVNPRHIPTPGPAFEAGYRIKSKAVGGSQGSHPAGSVSVGNVLCICVTVAHLMWFGSS